jgi:hypothetical protein
MSSVLSFELFINNFAKKLSLKNITKQALVFVLNLQQQDYTFFKARR